MREGWEYKKLGEVASSELGKTLNKSKDTGKLYPYICAVNVLWDMIDLTILKHAFFEKEEIDRYSVRKGDLLVCEGGDTGRSAIWEEEEPVLYQNALHRVRFTTEMEARFAMYCLWHLKNNGQIDQKYSKGVTIKHLVKSSLLSIELPVPPLSTQLSIVSELDKINELIHLKKEQLKDYDNLAQSIFYEMFGDPHDNEKRWDEVIVGDVCAPKAQILRASKIFGSTDEIQYIDISSIDNLAHEMTQCTTYTMSDAPSRAQQCVKKGDIIISTVRPNIKNIAIVSKDDENLVASSGFCILRPNNIDRNFLFHYILSEYYTEYLVNLTTGANYPAVRDSDILKSKIYYPPISIQQSFAQRIELIKKQKAEIKSTIADLETLLASRMQYWFD